MTLPPPPPPSLQGGADSLSPAELCAAQQATRGDVYRGPYMLGGGATLNCSQPPAYPGALERLGGLQLRFH
jgi:hypothetical protein